MSEFKELVQRDPTWSEREKKEATSADGMQCQVRWSGKEGNTNDHKELHLMFWPMREKMGLSVRGTPKEVIDGIFKNLEGKRNPETVKSVKQEMTKAVIEDELRRTEEDRIWLQPEVFEARKKALSDALKSVSE